MDRDEQEGTIGQRRDDRPDNPDGDVLRQDPGDVSHDRPGRSEDSPGHMKRDAGAQSARDFAPGRQRRA